MSESEQQVLRRTHEIVWRTVQGCSSPIMSGIFLLASSPSSVPPVRGFAVLFRRVGSMTIFSSVIRRLTHVGCANFGRCSDRPNPRILRRIPSLGVYAMCRRLKYPTLWIDTPVAIRSIAKTTKEERYKRCTNPARVVALISAIVTRQRTVLDRSYP